MGDTTNINQLPQNEMQNITLNTQENVQMPQMQQMQQMQQMPQMQQVSVNENQQHSQQPNMFSSDDQLDFVKKINLASESGATQLPSRDIPRNTNNITIDPNVKVNYIDNSKPADYINLHDTEENLIANNNKRNENTSFVNKLFEEFQLTIIIVVLFFSFQLPIFNSTLLKFIPKIFDNAGNLKFNGIIVKSILFGLAFYLITKSSDTLLQKFS